MNPEARTVPCLLLIPWIKRSTHFWRINEGKKKDEEKETENKERWEVEEKIFLE